MLHKDPGYGRVPAEDMFENMGARQQDLMRKLIPFQARGRMAAWLVDAVRRKDPQVMRLLGDQRFVRDVAAAFPRRSYLRTIVLDLVPEVERTREKEKEDAARTKDGPLGGGLGKVKKRELGEKVPAKVRARHAGYAASPLRFAREPDAKTYARWLAMKLVNRDLELSKNLLDGRKYEELMRMLKDKPGHQAALAGARSRLMAENAGLTVAGPDASARPLQLKPVVAAAGAVGEKAAEKQRTPTAMPIPVRTRVSHSRFASSPLKFARQMDVVAYQRWLMAKIRNGDKAVVNELMDFGKYSELARMLGKQGMGAYVGVLADARGMAKTGEWRSSPVELPKTPSGAKATSFGLVKRQMTDALIRQRRYPVSAGETIIPMGKYKNRRYGDPGKSAQFNDRVRLKDVPLGYVVFLDSWLAAKAKPGKLMDFHMEVRRYLETPGIREKVRRYQDDLNEQSPADTKLYLQRRVYVRRDGTAKVRDPITGRMHVIDARRYTSIRSGYSYINDPHTELRAGERDRSGGFAVNDAWRQEQELRDRANLFFYHGSEDSRRMYHQVDDFYGEDEHGLFNTGFGRDTNYKTRRLEQRIVKGYDPESMKALQQYEYLQHVRGYGQSLHPLLRRSFEQVMMGAIDYSARGKALRTGGLIYEMGSTDEVIDLLGRRFGGVSVDMEEYEGLLTGSGRSKAFREGRARMLANTPKGEDPYEYADKVRNRDSEEWDPVGSAMEGKRASDRAGLFEIPEEKLSFRDRVKSSTSHEELDVIWEEAHEFMKSATGGHGLDAPLATIDPHVEEFVSQWKLRKMLVSMTDGEK